MIRLQDCFKGYTTDQDKAVTPEQTVASVKACMAEACAGVLQETDRVDTGRLGIPVFVSKCGPKAAEVMPTRKQMGKGASPEQAEASALMELVERFSYFTFWNTPSNFEELTWSEAAERWPDELLPVSEIIKSVGEIGLSEADAVRLLDLVRWKFHPAHEIATEKDVYVPLDWFKKLNEFNGSSAGNTFEESILQGACELVERHVCAVVDRTRPELPTIDPASSDDPVLARLVECFAKCGVKLVLKDFTLGFPVPTVAAVAWDPGTFPGLSEIVFTAGTSATPEKAAVRAVTEVAQLAGDFETSRVYEASGLPKFTQLEQIDWLRQGPTASVGDLPDVEHQNIRQELQSLAEGLKAMGYTLFSVDTTHPELGVTANYNFVPGFLFRERTPHASLGMFVGRILAEEAEFDEALIGLEVLAEVYPDAHFVPFFKGLLALRMDDVMFAADRFAEAEPLQPAPEEAALCAFYQAYALTLAEEWEEAVPHLERAIAHDAEVKEFFNLRGVCFFRQGDYEAAAADFQASLDIDSGNPEDLANLGLCHKFMGNKAEAVDYLDVALSMNPGLEWARAHYEELLAEQD
ncbi:YcaO-like family protein [Salidesulfovibrio brasiliensis]|uniref:YcaO-like family protein n=1 Tax=Salidesulfovibrio brasiliensis TaxID=221711 RepID=UPI0006D26FA1|nr:YcaO-like family protein [Salidesulfovibrio brasiliensis]